jgi:RNA 2',3'-cyclic 3'-phosphodiesterase
MNTTPKTRRLFFALWPPDQTRQSIVRSFSSLSLPTKGRIISPGYLHITLHFLGQVSDERKECMHLAAQSIEASSFEVVLDHFGYFPRSRVFWLGSQKKPAGVVQLYHELGQAIAACGYQFEARAFTPHITLMRKCAKPEYDPADFSIAWPVNEFVLVESTTTESGVHYQVIEKYALS